MEMFGIASVAAIVVIAYLVGLIVKASGLDNKWIPIICGVSGGVLGALAFTIIPVPDFPASDMITAVAIGIVSGLGATGADQIGKQFSRKTDIEK